MNSDLGRRFEYPYAARYGAGPAAADELPAWDRLRTVLRRWLRRLYVAAAAVGLVLAIGMGMLAYQAVSAALFVAELRSRNCDVTFLHHVPGETDPLPRLVRDLVGDEVWSEIAGVSYDDSRFGWMWRQSREDDIPAICRACRGLDKLRSFSISGDRFTFALISDWPHLDQLEELELASSQLTDANLARISRLPKLKHLKLASSAVSSGGVRQLARLPELETLELRRIRGAADLPTSAGGFPSLTRLVIEETEVDDEMIVGLGPLPLLAEAVLARAKITDVGLAHLLNGGNLDRLVLNDGPDALPETAAIRCPEPRSYHVVDVPITGQGLTALADQEVTSLILDKTLMTDVGLAVVGQMKGLRYLSLRETKVAGTGAAQLGRLKTLARLDLTACPLTSDGIAALAKARLHHLILAKTPLTDEQLRQFASCDTITQLDLSETRVTPEGIRALYEARKRRLAAAGRSEMLIIVSDWPDITEAYVDGSRLRAVTREEDSLDPAY